MNIKAVFEYIYYLIFDDMTCDNFFVIVLGDAEPTYNLRPHSLELNRIFIVEVSCNSSTSLH